MKSFALAALLVFSAFAAGCGGGGQSAGPAPSTVSAELMPTAIEREAFDRWCAAANIDCYSQRVVIYRDPLVPDSSGLTWQDRGMQRTGCTTILNPWSTMYGCMAGTVSGGVVMMVSSPPDVVDRLNATYGVGIPECWFSLRRLVSLWGHEMTHIVTGISEHNDAYSAAEQQYWAAFLAEHADWLAQNETCGAI